MRRKTVSVAVLSLLAMLTLTFNLQPAAPQPPVVIGWAHPLTGPVAGTAAVHHLYYDMIVSDYNKKGGLNVGGAGLRTINTIVYDDGYDPGQSLLLIEKLITVDNVDLLFAPWSTAFCVAALPLFESYQYPVVGLTVGSNTISQLLMDKTYTYFFLTLGQPWEDALDMGALFAHINASVGTADEIGKVGITYRSDEHGIEHAEAIRDNLTAIGIDVPVFSSYDWMSPPTDWVPTINSFITADVDVAMICGYDEGAAFIRECIDQDYNPNMIVHGPALETPFLVYDVFGFTTGEMAGCAYYNGFPATAFETPTLKAWAKYHEMWTGNYSFMPYLPFPASSVFYMGLECLFMAVETPGIGLNRPAIRDALETQTFDTSLGTFKFRTGRSPQVENHGTLTQWQGGEMMEVIWPPENASCPFVIYPMYPWSWADVPDVNRDGKVRVDDVLIAALAFGSEPCHPRWEKEADVNGDNKVRVDDILAIALEFGATAASGGTVPIS